MNWRCILGRHAWQEQYISQHDKEADEILERWRCERCGRKEIVKPLCARVRERQPKR